MAVNINDRRPIATRDKPWAKKSALWLKNKGITPNQISLASSGCALLSGLCFVLAFNFSSWFIRDGLLLLAAALIQGRLICNLLDGMVAVEGGLATPAGPVYNELPDRLSDTLIFVGVGYGLNELPFAGTLGWIAALLALMTAYLRLLGGTCGLRQHFLGPMAKQHRMALLCGCTLLALFLPAYYGQKLLFLCLAVISLGSLFTCWRRGKRILDELHQNAVTQEKTDE
ncbi:CDP-alcohol phosphatidyltransferase family protein [Buttiauxella selenatireducens]|uniref:CDP-alcohol phosphatidyltransferase family protein n=1 Tax=Buttiauxella selenatireducens TaxID=3073902 RepID=A0ABY9S4W5_9ENTR|nr:CDP-alcohol phosphatidyltransferase family protein [Buttiauxella sp. R73]WMY72542.1 CDP-alcohol phosphatidyltransferase family protein [Buttiauxella sp. R73]